MGRTGVAAAWCVLSLTIGVASAGSAEELGGRIRDPTPESVSFLASAGFLEPLDRFGDEADGGLLLSLGGLYRLGWVAPEFALQYGFLDGPPDAGNDTTIDTWRVLGGLRVYLAPSGFFLRPWAGMLAGWGHYESSPRRDDLRPIFAPGRAQRDDVMLSAGGGLEVRLHPNLSLGGQIRYDHSFTDDSDTGERDLQSLTALGTVSFDY